MENAREWEVNFLTSVSFYEALWYCECEDASKHNFEEET